VSWADRILGIVLGLILGIGVVVVFVFVFSEETVDAPSISRETTRAEQGNRGGGSGGEGRPSPPSVATVRIVGGAPPAAGPAELRYRKGELVRLRIVSDQSVSLQLLGYGPPFTAPAGRPTVRRFNASKAGDFGLVVLPSHIDVARISVDGPGS
jgi:hypothetical protein